MGMIECIREIAEERGYEIVEMDKLHIIICNDQDQKFTATATDEKNRKGDTVFDFGATNEDFESRMKSYILAKIDEINANPRATTPTVSEEARNMPVKGIEDLTIADVKQYINPKATDQEAYAFLQLCAARKVNPFLREVYLIIFVDRKGERQVSMVMGKDYFTKRAEEHPQFDGFQAGVIVKQQDGNICWDREGTFVMDGETLLGGWAIVYRKDKKNPYKAMVSMAEYGKDNRLWKQMPATMIRKVALVQALREAIPSEFSGSYDEAEMEVGNEIKSEMGVE